MQLVIIKKKKSHCESGLESVKMGWLFLYYHPAKHLDYQQRKLWLVLGARQPVPMPLNMEKMMTTRGKKGDKDEEDCKLENEKKGKYKLL